MKRINFLLGVFAVSFFCAHSQQATRKFPPSVNNPSMDVFSPFISLDGSSLVFASYYGLERELLLFYTQRDRGDWKPPVELPKHINKGLTLTTSYTLSPDGTTLYLTSIKGGGVGLFDIWYTQLQGTKWTELQNIYAPINSKSNDGSPTFTSDGKTMYFMRCDQMTQQKASQCKIFMTKKNNLGKWEEPVELPSKINTGNSQAPRIMADGETLIFSSDKLSPNKGGMDLYYSKLKDGEWSDPLPMDFVNTEKDDQYVSVMASGRYLTMSQKGERKMEIVDVLIPKEIRPRRVMKVEGTILDESGKPTPAYISAVDLSSNQRVYSGRPDSKDGSFFLYLSEGTQYELSIEPEIGNKTYFSKQYDLDIEIVPTFDRLNVVLKPLAPEDEINLDAFTFKENSSELVEVPSSELRRLTRLMKASDLNFEIQVMLIGFEEDTIRSSPDLTEMIIDSVIYKKESIDTLGQLYTYDSLVVNVSFNNNRTDKQAQAVIDKLVGLGINRERLTYFINARPKVAEEKKKIIVKCVARK